MEWNREALGVLIQAYREEKCLYDTHDPLYHNKHARKERLRVVGDKVRAILPTATDEDCKTRFTSMRSHYCAELKKIKNSERSGAGASDVYKPTVWWYKELTYLKDYVTPRKSVSNIPSCTIPQSLSTAGSSSSSSNVNESYDNEEITEIVECSEDDSSNYSQEIFTVECGEEITPNSTPQNSPQSPPQRDPYTSSTKRRKRDNVDELATSTLSVLKGIQVAVSSANEDDKFGQYVAAELKKMSIPAVKAEVKLNIMKAITDGVLKHCNE